MNVCISRGSDHFLNFLMQDGRIDYNEFVEMMQTGNAVFGKRGSLQNSFSFSFRRP